MIDRLPFIHSYLVCPCASAGNCTAGGAYADSSGKQEGFVVSEVHGTWGKAREVPAPN